MTRFHAIRQRFAKKRTPALDWSSREVRLKMARETAKSPEVEEALQRLYAERPELRTRPRPRP
jgi:hypothetical protein